MPFTCSFQLNPGFVLLRGVGTVNLVMWANAMRQVIADPAFRDTMPVLLDVSEASGTLEPDEIVTIARTWRLLVPYSNGAIVAQEGVMLAAARQIEELSEDRVRAFADLPAAVQWLNDSIARASSINVA